MKLAATLAVALLSASSFAFAPDGGGNNTPGDENTRDQSTTGSINTEGRTVEPVDRTNCEGEGIKSTECQSLGAETNPN